MKKKLVKPIQANTENSLGLKITYRIKAQLGEIQSQPSNTSVVNDVGIAPVIV